MSLLKYVASKGTVMWFCPYCSDGLCHFLLGSKQIFREEYWWREEVFDI